MKIYERLEFQWIGDGYKRTLEISYEHGGDVDLLCGATGAQKQLGSQESSFYTQMTQQAGQVFGNDSSVFNSLMSTFAPTVAAGPNQQGFSPAELSNLNSEAITQTGQSYKNAKAAVGNAQAASGGGNTPLPSGATIGENTALASSAANQTASELGQITEQNYAVGRQNYQNATTGLANATNAFNSSSSFDNAATNSGNAASSTQNQIAQENSSWMQALSGAVGAAAGAASHFSGGSDSPDVQSAAGYDPLGEGSGFGGAPFQSFSGMNPLGGDAAPNTSAW